MKSVLDGKQENLSPKISYCSAYTSLVILDPYGKIYPCWDFVDNEEHQIGTFHPEVNYYNKNLDLWRGRGREVLTKECLECPYVLLHGSGCQAEAHRRTGDYWQRDCEDFPFQFDLAVKAALGDLDIRNREVIHSDSKCASCGSTKGCAL